VVLAEDCAEARQLQNDTLARLRRVLGEDHLLTLRSASLLGLTPWSLGNYHKPDSFKAMPSPAAAASTVKTSPTHCSVPRHSQRIGKNRRCGWPVTCRPVRPRRPPRQRSAHSSAKVVGHNFGTT
jgi:hypothetical protein